jgi:hypothetical protein
MKLLALFLVTLASTAQLAQAQSTPSDTLCGSFKIDETFNCNDPDLPCLADFQATLKNGLVLPGDGVSYQVQNASDEVMALANGKQAQVCIDAIIMGGSIQVRTVSKSL